MTNDTTPAGTAPEGHQSDRQVQDAGQAVATGQTHRAEQANAGFSAEDTQKFKEMFNAMIDEERDMRSSLRRTFNSGGELVAVSSGWHHMDEDEDMVAEEFVNGAFDAIEEEYARLAHDFPSPDAVDGQAIRKPDLAEEEGQ